MNYQTRMMVARREFTHDGQELKVGEPFYASGVDAAYLHRNGKAEFSDAAVTASKAEAASPAQLPAQVEAQVEAPAQRADDPVGNPTASDELAAGPVESEAASQDSAEVEDAAEVVATAPVTRRRGSARSTN